MGRILSCTVNIEIGLVVCTLDGKVGTALDRTIRIASGRRNGQTDEITWGAANPSDYDYPGKDWEDYRDRPGGILEAMA